jgi:hypothetical protein
MEAPKGPYLVVEGQHPVGEGLKELLPEVFGRLSGTRPDANPVIKLGTSMGVGRHTTSSPSTTSLGQ